MYAAARGAVERARVGGGPSLIDAQCVRFMPNTSNDDDTRYRDRVATNAGQLIAIFDEAFATKPADV